MFTRIVEVTSKPGKSYELADMVREKVLPILRQQAGFIDEVILTSETESELVIAMSFWRSKQDAEKYHREQFDKITQPITPLAEGAPVVRTFNVHTSTAHKIVAGIAA